MAETAGLTVVIDGDISGLSEAINEAQARIDELSSHTVVGYGGGDFTAARRRYKHWANSGNRSVDEQIDWWKEAMSVYSWDTDAVWEARENIYKLSRQKAKDINGLYDFYAEKNNYFKDALPDSDKAAKVFDEFKELNKNFLENGVITGLEYDKNVSKFGSELYKGRIKASEEWLTHEEKYNRLSVDDYVKGLERMDAYTRKYFEDGIISYEEYLNGIEYIADEKAKKYMEQYSSWKNDASVWISDRDLYGDWEMYGDSTLDFYDRLNDRIREFYSLGKISWDTMNEELKEADRSLFKILSQGDEVYKAWEKDAQGWKKMRDTFDDWEMYGDSTVAFYKRCIDRISEMYKEGHIAWQKYMDDTMEYQLKLYKASEADFDSVLKSMSEYINELSKKYKKEEESLKEKWNVEDRQERLSELSGQINIYRNAVTEKGKTKYKALLDEEKKLRREEEMYDLQKAHSATIDKLSEQYTIAERNKDTVLKGIQYAGMNIADIEKLTGIKFDLFGSKTENLLQQLITAVNNSARAISMSGGSSYTDNRNIKIATGMNSNEVWAVINGTVIEGLGSVTYGGTTFTLNGH